MKIEVSQTELTKLSKIIENGFDDFENRAGKVLGRRLSKVYTDALEDISVDIRNIVNRYDGRDLSKAQLAVISREPNIYNAILAKLESYGIITANELKEYSLQGFQKGYYTDRYVADRELNFVIGGGFINQSAINAAINNLAFQRAVSDLTESQKVAIQNSIASGIIRGQSITQMSNAIKSQLNNNKKRAVLIARTESHRSYNAGAVENEMYLSDLGIKYKKIWLATNDSRTRLDHVKMNMVEADNDGFFHLPDGSIGEAPGLTGVARQDIRCRCTYIKEIIDVENPNIEAMINSSKKNTINFNEWYKAQASGSRKYI